jgi:hypothetical protein
MLAAAPTSPGPPSGQARAPGVYGGQQRGAVEAQPNLKRRRRPAYAGFDVSGTVGGQGLQFSILGVTQSPFNDAIEPPIAA